MFLKDGKLLRDFANPQTADEVIADIDILTGQLDYNSFSLNIYPDQFDADADAQVDPSQQEAYAQFGRILDHCWDRGVFCSLSFETYNVGGGGTPAALFSQHPEVSAINALGEVARDVEYGGTNGKLIPSVYHPLYLAWSRDFIRNFLTGLGPQRTDRLLFVETTVEPQYLGRCNVGDRDDRRAFLDFSAVAHAAFDSWQQSFPAGDPHRTQLSWPQTQAQRDQLMGNRLFNDFRAQGLAGWINGDIAAIRSVAPDVYIAVDYNGRFDDPYDLRIGTHSVFLNALAGADIIQIAPHVQSVWGPSSWDDVIAVNSSAGKHWAISEHMTATGSWGQDDAYMTEILDDTLARGTRWGWEFVNVGNRHPTDDFQLYYQDWTSDTLDIIEGANWNSWLAKIGAARFVPRPRGRTAVAVDLGSPDIEQGITHPQNNDGDTMAVAAAGRTCRRNVNDPQDQYFFFAVDDSFAYRGNLPDVYIVIEYLDVGTSSLRLDYDAIGSTSGAWYKNGGSVTLSNSGTWKAHVFHVVDAWFGNRQNVGADFRIASPQNTFYLDTVQVFTQQPIAPQLAEVSDPVIWRAGTAYTQQMELLAGYPAPAWLVVQAPAGVDVSDTGLLTGWTPAPGDWGSHLFEVQAANVLGSARESWVVKVVSRADFDADEDVDQGDFGLFQECLSGAGQSPTAVCVSRDLDGDGDVDQADASLFMGCLQGAAVQPGG
jgi:hypothetical protein